MTDTFEKKIDKHYTYIYKQEFGVKDKNWSIARQEHEPGERPSFNSPTQYVVSGLSEGFAKSKAIELQLTEINRRRTY